MKKTILITLFSFMAQGAFASELIGEMGPFKTGPLDQKRWTIEERQIHLCPKENESLLFTVSGRAVQSAKRTTHPIIIPQEIELIYLGQNGKTVKVFNFEGQVRTFFSIPLDAEMGCVQNIKIKARGRATNRGRAGDVYLRIHLTNTSAESRQ